MRRGRPAAAAALAPAAAHAHGGPALHTIFLWFAIPALLLGLLAGFLCGAFSVRRAVGLGWAGAAMLVAAAVLAAALRPSDKGLLLMFAQVTAMFLVLAALPFLAGYFGAYGLAERQRLARGPGPASPEERAR